MSAQHIQNALAHLTMFIAPGADDTASVRYVTTQLQSALSELGIDDYPRPSDAQIEAMLEEMARTYGFGDPCANCGEPLTDDGGIGWYCIDCSMTVQFHD